MNNLKETILKRMLIRLFLILLQDIRNFFMQFRLYPFRRRVLAGVLCVCLVTLLMPFPVLAAENSVDVQENMHDEINEIVSFTEQPDEVKEQPSERKEETLEKDTDERNESELENSDNQNGNEFGDSGNEGEKDEKELGDSDYEDAEKPENSDGDNGETSEGSTDEENVENSDGTYTLVEDVELPEISVTETEVMLEELSDVSGSTTPACGVISSDTTWGEGTLSDGELIIEPGVTLTINGQVIIKGTVTIKGGGTIRRGNGNAYIAVTLGADVTIGNITIDGASILGGYSMIGASGDVTICDGCIIRNCISINQGAAICNYGNLTIRDTTISNCSSENVGGAICDYGGLTIRDTIISNCSSVIGGAIYSEIVFNREVVLTMENTSIISCSADRNGGAIHMAASSAILENITIENCWTNGIGGAIVMAIFISNNTICYEPDLTIKGGKFIDNISDGEGGCIDVAGGTLNIYGGEFIGNTSASRGGCICQDTYTSYTYAIGSVINISGGYFEGNTCTNKRYEGSGAVYSSNYGGQLILSSDAQFCGDDAYGTDGIMLDDGRKVLISDTLKDSATVYVIASDGRVIAEGMGGYILSLEKDIEKIKFVDIGNSGEKYETVLDEANNQIKLSRIEPSDSYNIQYISNGAQGQVVDDTEYEEGDTITVKSADGLSWEGHRFIEWNTVADGSGTSYQPGDKIEEIKGDITLYAQWISSDAEYTVEHYLQDISGTGYTRVEKDTENLGGTVGEVVNAMPKTYRGFTENTTHESRKESGVVASDGSLVLRLYYDRDVYHITFDLNGGTGTAPAAQTLRYGALLQEVGRPEKPGYTFLGWYKEEPGTEGEAWDFDKPVEENTEKESVTLYAGWVDDIAPVLMQAEFNEGYKSFHDWTIRKRDLIITIPIIEEGSGVKQANYVLSSLEKLKNETEPQQAQIIEENGRTVAKITISYDFKGTVSVTCSDNAGNISAGKTLTSSGGGTAFIVEDNAPEITFSSKDGSLSDSFYGDVTVTVSVNDEETQGNANTAENTKITGGIASVAYCLDDGAETTVEGKGFESGIVPSCDFSVKISGVGEHILKVTAIDNAGNKNTSQVRIKIAQQSAAQKNKTSATSASSDKSSTLNLPTFHTSTHESEQFTVLTDPQQPIRTTDSVKDNEPRTGDTFYMEVYETIAAVTGFLYLLLYLRRKKTE